ncbi:MAG: hypothetical protein WBE11_18395 [Candidatus Aminicenantaceae bacterium]
MSTRQKFFALFLVITFMGMNCATYEKGAGINLDPGQKPGAKVIIQKIDGLQVRGELIAVKQNSLLLKQSESGADVTVVIRDIVVIKIVKKSKALLGAGIGFLISSSSLWILAYSGDTILGSAGFEDAIKYSLIYGIPGALLGGGVGAKIGTDKTIKFEGKSEAEIKNILENLRKKARVPDFQ